MAAATQGTDTLDDLMKVKGKAELVNGRIVTFMSTGRVPGRIAKRILRSLDDYEIRTRSGEALGDNVGYALRAPLPNGRQSFNPDVSYYIGTSAYNDPGFIDDVPTVAVEVRSEHDFGPANDIEYADKRADYFLAGTPVVLDVDYRAQTVTVYRSGDTHNGTVFAVGDTLDVEPTLPGWRLAVADIFA